MDNLIQDLNYGLRTLLKSPGFTAVAILTLALGIGANTAIFSVVNAVLLKALPYDHPERLVSVKSSRTVTSGMDFRDWHDRNRSFEYMGTYLENTAYNLSGDSEPERTVGTPMSAEIFFMLGVSPALGRTFLPEEDVNGGNKVVVLSHSLWQQRFGGDPNVLGKTLRLDNETYTIVGVMPKSFSFPAPDTALWTPIAIDYQDVGRGNYFFLVVGKLKPGVQLQQAAADMDSIALQLEHEYPDTNTNARIALVPMQEQITGKIRPMLFVLFGAVGFVLLIACTNVANLLLARATARRKEIAIRCALGASRLRIVQQLLSESVLLSLFGGALGLLVATWGTKALIAITPEDIPRVMEIGIDRRVLVFTLAITFLTGILFGLAPALQASKPDIRETINEGGRGSTSANQFLRGGLVVAQIALAVVLLIGTGLVLRSFVRLMQVDPGFSTTKVLTFDVALPYTQYRERKEAAVFFNAALERIATLPGVQHVGVTTALPLSKTDNYRYMYIENRPPSKPGAYTGAGYRSVSSDYFQTMSIPIVRGRGFTTEDREGASPVVVLNNAFVRRFFPNEDPIGKRITMGTQPNSSNTWMTVVGIVGDVNHSKLDAAPRAEMYRPYLQAPERTMTFAVRSALDPESMTASIRREILALDRTQPMANIFTMERLYDHALSGQRFTVLLLGVFSVLALFLSVIGLYGVMSYTVAQSTREIGIRMALGAQRSDVYKLIVGQGLVFTLIGLGIGIGLAFGLTRLMVTLLFGVTATDPMTFAGVSIVLTFVALTASYMPARKAIKVDPMIALRYE